MAEKTTLPSARDAESERGRAHLLVIAGGAVSSHALPERGSVSIGRSEACDVRVADASISRKHAVLHVSGAGLEIEDLGSANGTRVREGLLKAGARRAIAEGEVVEIGDALIIAQKSGASRGASRVFSHAGFEARLEGEHARAEASGASFGVVRVHCERAVPPGILEDRLAGILGERDAIGSYAPGELEILLSGATAEKAEATRERIEKALVGSGIRGRVGLASYPRDGQSAHLIFAQACARASSEEPGEIDATRRVITIDPAMRRIFSLVEQIAAGDISVLLLGETGVGKEIVAEAIHQRSPRAKAPLVRLNCAALTETLLESELFGHERGAFTGATHTKAGLLESAEGGTVFLDEVGDLPAAAQVKLLRVIEERRVMRVGGLKPRAIDVRFVAATHRDLEAEITRGAFRQDLYFRLSGVSIPIPPLRERPAEIAEIARLFIDEAARKLRRPVPLLGKAALDLLQAHTWPGNIRELRNVIERAVLLCSGGSIEPDHLPVEKLLAKPALIAAVPAPAAEGLRRDRDAVERDHIVRALNQSGGNQTEAAKLLGISRRTLSTKLDYHGIGRPRKR
jgi:DNA-binding NtrC family response regulator/pSer/pThr/pTyr-binding forkhead associated (FHA) protein